MGFGNFRDKTLGEHRYQIALYRDKTLLKLFSTDVEFGLKVLEESARSYVSYLKRENPSNINQEYRLVRFDNTRFNPLERILSSEVL
jgi:hypothetical protein